MGASVTPMLVGFVLYVILFNLIFLVMKYEAWAAKDCMDPLHHGITFWLKDWLCIKESGPTKLKQIFIAY